MEQRKTCDRSQNICSTCGKSFSTQWNLRRHARKLHEEVSSLTCQHCQMEFSGVVSLRAHVKGHLDQTSSNKLRKSNTKRPSKSNKSGGRVLCNVCDLSFSSAFSLSRHHLSKHEDIRPPYECSPCSIQFPLKNDFILHIKVRHGGDVNATRSEESPPPNPEDSDTEIQVLSTRLVCKHCQKVFHAQHRYESHLRQQHTKLPSGRAVGQADHGTGTRGQLLLPSNGSETVRIRRVRCPVCPSFLEDQLHLKDHINKVHPSSKEALPVCDVCGEFCKDIPELFLHLQEEHSRESYCTTCHRSFRTEEDLENHLLQGGTCTACQLPFDSFCDLNLHAKQHLKWCSDEEQ